MSLFYGYSGKEEIIRKYVLVASTSKWYLTDTGKAFPYKPSNAIGYVPVKEDSVIRILTHVFDGDGLVPDGTGITYALWYMNDVDSTEGYVKLGTVTYAKIIRNGKTSIGVVNTNFDLSTISFSIPPVTGYMGFIPSSRLPAGNESMVVVSVYDKLSTMAFNHRDMLFGIIY